MENRPCRSGPAEMRLAGHCWSKEDRKSCLKDEPKNCRLHGMIGFGNGYCRAPQPPCHRVCQRWQKDSPGASTPTTYEVRNGTKRHEVPSWVSRARVSIGSVVSLCVCVWQRRTCDDRFLYLEDSSGHIGILKWEVFNHGYCRPVDDHTYHTFGPVSLACSRSLWPAWRLSPRLWLRFLMDTSATQLRWFSFICTDLAIYVVAK